MRENERNIKTSTEHQKEQPKSNKKTSRISWFLNNASIVYHDVPFAACRGQRKDVDDDREISQRRAKKFQDKKFIYVKKRATNSTIYRQLAERSRSSSVNFFYWTKVQFLGKTRTYQRAKPRVDQRTTYRPVDDATRASERERVNEKRLRNSGDGVRWS